MVTPAADRTADAQAGDHRNAPIARITMRRLPPHWWRRLRNGAPRAASARYDLPRDYASRIRETVAPFGVHVDVITNSRRIFEADLHGAEKQLNMACAAVLDFWESDDQDDHHVN